MMSVNDISGLFVPVAVVTAFALLRKFLPAPRPAELPQFSLEKLNHRFRYVQWVVGAGIFLGGAFIAWITHKLLVNLNLFFAAKDGPATFELLPSPAIWWFLPGAAALTLGWELTLLLWSIFGDRLKIAQYIQWSNVKAGFDSTKALRWLSLLVTLPVGVLTALAVPMHTTLLEGSMCIREYAAPSSLRYPYKDARRLAAVASLRDRDGKSQPRAEILVKFSDGRVWSSAANRDFEKHVDADLLKFLQMKTGLHVEHAEAEADLSPSF